MKDIKKFLCLIAMINVTIIMAGCGATVDSTKKEESIEQKSKVIDTADNDLSECMFTNVHNLYTLDINNKSGVIQQRDIEDGTLIKEVEVQGLEKILMVSDEQIYYESISDKGASVCEIPLQEGKSHNQILVEKKKKVLDIPKDEEGIHAFYAQGNYILYITEIHNLWRYNLETKESKCIDYDVNYGIEFATRELRSDFGDTVYFTYGMRPGLSALSLKETSSKMKMIDSRTIGNFISNNNIVFYTASQKGGDEVCVIEKEDKVSSKTAISSEQFEAILSKYNTIQVGKEIYQRSDYAIEHLYLDEQKIYIGINVKYELGDICYEKELFFSASIDDMQEIIYEKKISDFLETIQKYGEDYDLSGWIEEFNNGTFLIEGIEADGNTFLSYCYDIKSGKSEKVRQKNGAWWMKYYNHQSEDELY